jgi:eukaryotic-like serine/threonine-protein kinase
VIGQTVSHYRILSKLGEGGMGTVYVAEDTLLGRRVAIKSLKIASVPGQTHFRTRFLREARAASLLNHPHIATVHDYGETEDGQPYLVMELIDGQSLSDLLREASLPVDRAVGIIKQVTEAIAEAHRHGIVHRDIKPSNVLVTLHDGVPVPKVIDFGIAKATQGELTDKTLFTQFQQFIGTPAYISPEQAETSGLDVDTRSDI